MRRTKLFNGFGFAGQHGAASKLIEDMYAKQNELIDEVGDLLVEVPLIDTGVNTLAGNLSTLTTLVDKIKALINVTVTFNTDGGSTVESQTIPFGTVATLPEAPTKEGYTIIGWYLGENPFNYETLVESNITLTAHWTETVPEG